jgi:hypothetical protein
MSESELRVSSGRPPRFILEAAKETLKKTSRVELHGLGKAISSSVNIANSLVADGYAISTAFATRLETLTEGERPVPKVVITLVKGPNFDRVYEEFVKSTTAVDMLAAKK